MIVKPATNNPCISFRQASCIAGSCASISLLAARVLAEFGLIWQMPGPLPLYLGILIPVTLALCYASKKEKRCITPIDSNALNINDKIQTLDDCTTYFYCGARVKENLYLLWVDREDGHYVIRCPNNQVSKIPRTEIIRQGNIAELLKKYPPQQESMSSEPPPDLQALFDQRSKKST